MDELNQALERIMALPELIGEAGMEVARKKAHYEFVDKKKDATLSAIKSELSMKYPDYKENRLERMAMAQALWVDFLEERKQARLEELSAGAKKDKLVHELEALRSFISATKNQT